MLFQSYGMDSGKAITARQMVLHVNFDLLRVEKKYAPNLLLDIFGKSIQVTQTRMIKRGLYDYTWIGRISNDPLSNVLLTVADKIMFGRIEYSGNVYTIEPIEDGIFHRITKLDPTNILQFNDDLLIPSQIQPQKDATSSTVSQNTTSEPPIAALDNELDNGSVIDIMVLYTDGMAAAYPGSQVITKINALVDLANQAYTNSQVNTRLNLVNIQQISYTDGGSLNTALTELIDGTGVFSSVADLRDQYASDIVALIRKYQTSNNSCGLAYVMQTVSSSFASRAFSVTQEGKAGDGFRCSDYALAHEVGHNLGNVHDRANSTIKGAYDYSYGYDVAGVFGTIMSYEGPKIGYFSNPDITYSGYSIGVPEGQSDSADNAKSMRNNITTVARFRKSAAPDTTSPTLLISSPCSSSCLSLSSSITVSGSVADSGGSGLDRINIINGDNEWNDYNISGDSDIFSVPGISLNQNQNVISAQAYDKAGNSSEVYTIYVTYNLPCTDNDNDGYSPEGETCGPVDCDDNDPDKSPGKFEICNDTKDNDCDGATDIDDTDCAYLIIPDITVTDSISPADDLQVLFGDLLESNLSEQTISIKNDGTGDLVIKGIAQNNPLDDPFSIQSDNCSGETLEISYSCDLTIRFLPNTAGTFKDSFEISSNDPDEDPITINVEGTGISEITNKQPTPFQLVYPANKQTELGTTVKLRWKKSKDPEGNSVTYNLYYCNDTDPENCDPIKVAAASSSRLSIYSYAGILFFGIVVASGASRKRKITLLIAMIILSGIISVSCGDKSTQEEFGNEIDESRTNDEVSYTASGLNRATTYYWMIIAIDGDGEQTKSDIWSFTTKL